MTVRKTVGNQSSVPHYRCCSPTALGVPNTWVWTPVHSAPVCQHRFLCVNLHQKCVFVLCECFLQYIEVHIIDAFSFLQLLRWNFPIWNFLLTTLIRTKIRPEPLQHSLVAGCLFGSVEFSHHANVIVSDLIWLFLLLTPIYYYFCFRPHTHPYMFVRRCSRA